MAGNRNGLIRLDDSEIRELERLFSGVMPKELRRATYRALTRTRQGSKKQISDLVTKDGAEKYNVKIGRVKRGVFMTRIRNDAFTIFGQNRPISLSTFKGTRQLLKTGRNGKKRGAGVQTQVIQGDRKRIHSAFIARKGSDQVFRRVFEGGKQVKRNPIERLVGPSVADMMEKNDAEKRIADYALPRFDGELKTALNYVLARGK